MARVQIANTGLTVSRMGLGCMGMSEFYGPASDDESRLAIHAAHEAGINFFDTADMYGRGHNEHLVGDALRQVGARGSAVIATKFGISRDPSDPYRRELDNSACYIERACEASLRRLGVEVIDLYYVHRIDERRPIEETVGDLSRLVAAGKIKSIGLCEASAETIRRAHAVHPLAAVQSEYSLFTRDAEAAVLPVCKELGISFVAYSPLGRGMLTGTLSLAASGDMRRALPRFATSALSHNLSLVETLQCVAARHEATPAQIALAWLLARPDGVLPIPGTRKARRVIENARALEISMSPSELQQISVCFESGSVDGQRYTEEGMKGVQM